MIRLYRIRLLPSEGIPSSYCSQSDVYLIYVCLELINRLSCATVMAAFKESDTHISWERFLTSNWNNGELVDWCFEPSTTRDYIRAEVDFHKEINSGKDQ